MSRITLQSYAFACCHVAIRTDAALIFVNRAAQTSAKLQAPGIVSRWKGATMKLGLINTTAGLAAAFGAMPIAYAQGYGNGYGPGMMGGWGWSGGGLAMIGMFLWWVLIIVAIVLLLKWIFGSSPGRGGHHSHDRSLDILRERYARGEIDKKEFEDRRRDLHA